MPDVAAGMTETWPVTSHPTLTRRGMLIAVAVALAAILTAVLVGHDPSGTGREQDAWLGSWSQADAVVSRPIDPVQLPRVVADLIAARALTA